MSSSPSSPQEAPYPHSSITAARGIPDSDPSSSAPSPSSPQEALNLAPPILSPGENSKPDQSISPPSPSSQVNPILASSKPTPQAHPDTDSNPAPLVSSPTQPFPVNPQEAKKIASLEAKIAALETQVKATEEKQKEVDGKLKYGQTNPPIPPLLETPLSVVQKLRFLPVSCFPLLCSLSNISCLPRTKDAQAKVKAHIKLLHDYNEIRDVGQGLMGIIADNRGVRVMDIYNDFGVGEGD